MERYVFWYFIYSMLLFGEVWCSTCVPTSIKQLPNIAIANASSHTFDCPVVVVDSLQQCLKHYCTVKHKCYGNVVQYTRVQNTSLCYVLRCGTECTFSDSSRSLVMWIVNDSFKDCPSNRQCRDGECVASPIVQCNGVTDCQDGSDELNCYHAGCTEEEFECVRGGMCINRNMRCDGETSCGDGSDEMGCEEYLARHDRSTMMITVIAIGTIISLLLILLMFSAGQKLRACHNNDRRQRYRALRPGSGPPIDHRAALLPGDLPFDDSLPPPYSTYCTGIINQMLGDSDELPLYDHIDSRERLLDLAETSGYSSPQPSSPDSTKPEPSTSFSEEQGTQGSSSQENLIDSEVLDNLERLSELEG